MMKTDSPLELYIDTKFNEFDHRTTESEVLAVPEKRDTPVEVSFPIYNQSSCGAQRWDAD